MMAATSATGSIHFVYYLSSHKSGKCLESACYFRNKHLSMADFCTIVFFFISLSNLAQVTKKDGAFKAFGCT